MKKFLLTLLTIAAVISFANVYAAEQSIDGKIGTAYAKSPDKFGLDIGVDYFYELDPFFSAGIETGMYWMQWKKKLDSDEAASNLGTYPEETFDAFMFPILAVGQVRLPNFKESIGITPYFGGGLGLSIMSYSYYNGDKDVVDLFSGFTWMINAGVAYSPSSSSQIEFIGEVSYRGASLTHENRTTDMSGIKLNAGIRFKLANSGGGSYY